MAKITPMRKATSIEPFRKLYIRGILDWEEDERRGLAPEDRIRARWNKYDIMHICNWYGPWSKLRKLLEKRVGLIMLRYGAPLKGGNYFTFPTSEKDRERVVLNALALDVGVAKYAGVQLKNQLAPVDEKHALTEDGLDNVNAALLARHGATLDKVVKSIAELKGTMWQDDIMALAAPQPAATKEAHDEIDN